MEQQPPWVRASSFWKFHDHALRHTTIGRTPLDAWSTRSSNLYLTTHNTVKTSHPREIRTHSPSKWAAGHPRLRPCGLWDQDFYYLLMVYLTFSVAQQFISQSDRTITE